KFNGPGGAGKPPWVQIVPVTRRQTHSPDQPPDDGQEYAKDVLGALEAIHARGEQLCGFIAESCPSVAGQIMFPRGYLAADYRLVREAGGLCIADEVQTAYGRIGTHFYAFEEQGVVPDIVVLGKP